MNIPFKIIYLLMFPAFSGIQGAAQPTNPSNYCGWMYTMLGPDRYFKNDTLKLCSGYSIGGGFSFTLPNTTYKLDNAFVTYTSDSLGRIRLPTINSAGQHWFEITKDGCTARDSFFIIYVPPLPKVNLGPDTILCSGDSLLLDVGVAGASYYWNNNFTANQKQSFVVKSAGKYTVIVNLASCSSSDTILVGFATPPNLSLGPDMPICEGESIMLYPGYADASYRWQDGSTKPAFTVSAPGTYSVRMDHACGSFYDTITFTHSPCKFYVPNAFTPNNDGKNDVFKVLGHDNVSLFNFRIYNRWGVEVFYSSLPSKGWDGISKGQPQPQGVYTWLLEYKKSYSPGIFSQRGTVTLIR